MENLKFWYKSQQQQQSGTGAVRKRMETRNPQHLVREGSSRKTQDRDVPPSPSSSQPWWRAAYGGPCLCDESIYVTSDFRGHGGYEKAAKCRNDTHLRWTCGQFAIEGIVSDDVEGPMVAMTKRRTLVRAMVVQ